MKKRTLGYKRMEWICPNCQARNPGPEETCQACGFPQPDDVEFVLPQNANWVQDEQELQRASQGPDIYCPYCNARNPAGSTECQQCSAPLAEGKRRATRKVKVLDEGEQIPCPACKQNTPRDQATCIHCGAPLQDKQPEKTDTRKTGKKALWGILLAIFLLCSTGWFLFMRPANTSLGTVEDVYWQTTVNVEEMQPVRYENQANEPPAGAYNVDCQIQTHQVCEEKTVDRGNGYAEVVEECQDVKERICSYTVDEWQVIEAYPLEGHTLSPQFANPPLKNNQRLGSRTEVYQVIFTTDRGKIRYQPDSLTEFQRYTPGSQWRLELNTLGGVLSVSAP